MAYRYRLLDENGDDLGPFASGSPDIRAGEILHRGRGRLEVVRVVDGEPGGDVYAYLVVRVG